MCTDLVLYDVQSASKVACVFYSWARNEDMKRALYNAADRALQSATRVCVSLNDVHNSV